jgi:hypothetical protein
MNESSWMKVQLRKMASSKSKLIVQAKAKCFLMSIEVQDIQQWLL